MARLMYIFDQGDPCALGLVVIIVLLIGHHVAGEAELRWSGRLAVAAFVAYWVSRFAASSSRQAEDLFTITVRATLAAGFALGVGWLILPLGTSAVRYGFMVPLRRSREEKEAAHRRQAEQDQWRVQQEHQRREQERQDSERRQASERTLTEAQARQLRENARFECENLYRLLAHDLQDRFPPELFDAYLTKYLSDDLPVDLIEQRVREFQQFLQQHLEKVRPSAGRGVDALALWYQRQRDDILGSTLDDDRKDELLAELEDQYAELLKRSIKEFKQ